MLAAAAGGRGSKELARGRGRVRVEVELARWTPQQLEAVDGVVSAARLGHPCALVVEGEAGTGKSTLLAEVVRRADGFQVLTGEGVEAGLPPFGVLVQWGAIVTDDVEGTPVTPVLAVRRLGELADDLAGSGPLLLLLDDAQWADEDSIAAVSRLLQRVSGDRLLVVVAGRPDEGGEWHAWGPREHAQHVLLEGLREEDAVAIARDLAPRLSVEAARRLWRHTAGHPLYLNALLREYSAAQLTEARVLPAPAEFAEVTRRRVERLPAPARALIEAVAVLGTGWVRLTEALAVADLDEDPQVTDPLLSAGLAQVRIAEEGVVVRVAHALVRAAVYQHIPDDARRDLHTRAGKVVGDRAVALGHRYAAAVGDDDSLAAELEQWARLMHSRRDYRSAAVHLRWSAAVSSSPQDGEARRLDSLFDALLDQDFAVVRSELAWVRTKGDRLRRALILGAMPVLQGRWADGVRILADAARLPLAAGDALTRQRLETLLAWARILIGADLDLIEAGLDRLASLPAKDPALGDLAAMARGHALARRGGIAALGGQFSALPADPATAPPESSLLISWRGVVNMHLGALPAAIADLREAQRRLQEGQFADVMNGGIHGVLALSYWLHGQWDLAELSLRLAVEIPQDTLLPMVLVERVFLPAGRGDRTEADQRLQDATSTLHEVPWREAVQALLVARVVRAHAGGSAEEQGRVLPGMLQEWPGVPLGTGMVGPVWSMHLALAQIWARRLTEAEQTIAGMLTAPVAPPAPAAAHWLHGLVCEARGDRPAALRLLERAAKAGMPDLPLYHAHVLTDWGRLLAAASKRSQAATVLAQAEALYRRIGAAGYGQRLAELRAPLPPGPPQASPAVANPFHLSDRERDVLTLIVSGLSYSQIARELFITQSTVGYHLGNMYAKVGVSSRHELTALARSDPQRLGLTLATA